MYRRTIDEFGLLANRCSSTTDPFFCHDAQVDPSFSSYIDDHFLEVQRQSSFSSWINELFLFLTRGAYRAISFFIAFSSTRSCRPALIGRVGDEI